LHGNAYKFGSIDTATAQHLFYLSELVKKGLGLSNAQHDKYEAELFNALKAHRVDVPKPAKPKAASDDGSFIADCEFKGYKGIG
jgi:hypothetical protein